ncbi:transglutaminase family protein [Maribius pontilimi]|uniref:Transglutaminase family protein n=2 Tax=Palleronia pontilimi TaxID=1964209 RepID=A0A934IJQ9_9RHOB|nr:transglutaminase family protein [Palleronia pontilimi]MBJ3763820.1 transglutaminase family protein [Palleronia pontilimi]
MILALSAHSTLDARLVGEDRVRTEPMIPTREFLDGYGNRITRLVAPKGSLRLWSDCVAEVDGAPDPLVPDAEQHAIDAVADAHLTHLMASRYCDSDNLSDMAWATFGSTPPGWPRVQAICDFVHSEISFGYKFARSSKTASEVNREKTGVCRDFAHLAISLCRAMNIPSRYASGYLGDIGVPDSGPGDFCAWFEVYLGGRWFVFDARYNTRRIGRLPMVRGADASDVAMITSFGPYDLRLFRVWTDEVEGAPNDESLLEMLATRPESEPLVFPSSARVHR